MRSVTGRLALLVLLALGASCASSARSSGSPRPDRNVILRAEISAYNFHNAYEAVESLRSNWLLTKGPDSFTNPTPVWVYLDGQRLGGIELLRTISAQTIESIRHFDGISASARWGLDHGQGVIAVATRTSAQARDMTNSARSGR
jgi:hypothetical protein